MPTVDLLPNADVSNNPAWTIGTGSDVYAVLDDDDSGHVTTDSSDIEGTAAGKVCEVRFEDLDASLSDATINSVKLTVKHNNRGRGITYQIYARWLPHGSTSPYYTTVINGFGNASWQTATQTETTSDGSNAWTFEQVNALNLNLSLNAITGGTTGITYVYYTVDYTPSAIPIVKLLGGKTIIKGGKLLINSSV